MLIEQPPRILLAREPKYPSTSTRSFSSSEAGPPPAPPPPPSQRPAKRSRGTSGLKAGRLLKQKGTPGCPRRALAASPAPGHMQPTTSIDMLAILMVNEIGRVLWMCRAGMGSRGLGGGRCSVHVYCCSLSR